MKIIISPAKKMNVNTDDFPVSGLPGFMEKTEELMHWIQRLSLDEKRELWNCNDKLLELNRERFNGMNLRKCLTPAILSYEGIQYQYMAPGVMETDSLKYLAGHLCILSAFYGMVEAFNGVVPYRLEMQAKLKGKFFPGEHGDLYSYWGDAVYRKLTEADSMILNLASREYSKVIEPYLKETDTFVTCVFGEWNGEKVIQKGTLAKMARGEMVNWLASIQAEEPEKAKGFHRLGFQFREDLSTDREYVFVRKKDAVSG